MKSVVDEMNSYGFNGKNECAKNFNLAKENKLNYVIDIFPFYGSDADAALEGGLDAKHGLIGPGVAASHGMERTHLEGVENTMTLIELYLFGRQL